MPASERLQIIAAAILTIVAAREVFLTFVAPSIACTNASETASIAGVAALFGLSTELFLKLPMVASPAALLAALSLFIPGRPKFAGTAALVCLLCLGLCFFVDATIPSSCVLDNSD